MTSSFYKNKFIRVISCICILIWSLDLLAMDVPIYDYPLNYSQTVSDYLPSNASDYSTPMLTPEYQKQQLKDFYNHYFSSTPQGLSPWSEQMVAAILPFIRQFELTILEAFNNQNKPFDKRHYAENFQQKNIEWINSIQQNINLDTIDTHGFQQQNRAIAINNTSARELPDDAPDFFHTSIPGQGFPFDNLQSSAIWAGTSLYVLSITNDKAWSLVLTPDAYFAWVKSQDIAYTSQSFIKQWQNHAKESIVAITKTGVGILNDKSQFQFTGYIGAVFPLATKQEEQLSILIPVKNAHGRANIKTGIVKNSDAVEMPLPMSKKNMASILKQLQNRPYGWGGVFFHNDCSLEMKSIFTPFGIWLPRNSAQQGKLSTSVDLSSGSIDERLEYLQSQGHPMLTLIYIGGHVMLYVGNHDTENGLNTIITYQNVWGLSPKSKDRRYVIGRSVFFPLLKSYSEIPDVVSLAEKANFKLAYLDDLHETHSPQTFVQRYFNFN
ncbi:MAG: SH3 domain-containing protein [Legionellaceae bacterium]|nr:SH3 domain-containing protein [Legionellaceae bacterium]